MFKNGLELIKKFCCDGPIDKTVIAGQNRFPSGLVLKLLAQFEELAKEKSATPAQLALAWLMAKGEDIIPIPSSKSRRHLEENLKAIDTKLTEEDLVRLDTMFPPGVAAGDRARDMDRVNI